MLYLEAHAEDELADSFEDIGTLKEYRVPDTLFTDLAQAAGDQKHRLNWKVIRDAVKKRNGMPVAILQEDENKVEVTEEYLKTDPSKDKIIEKQEEPEPPVNMHFNG